MIPSIEAIDPENQAGRAFKGLLAFVDSNFAAAKEAFEPLIAEGLKDSGVAYMLGLILSREGERTPPPATARAPPPNPAPRSR